MLLLQDENVRLLGGGQIIKTEEGAVANPPAAAAADASSGHQPQPQALAAPSARPVRSQQVILCVRKSAVSYGLSFFLYLLLYHSIH